MNEKNAFVFVNFAAQNYKKAFQITSSSDKVMQVRRIVSGDTITINGMFSQDAHDLVIEFCAAEDSHIIFHMSARFNGVSICNRYSRYHILASQR